MLQNTRRRAERRGWPISAYVGPNGSGKTCAAVWDTLPSLERGRPVLSTVRLLDWRNPRPCDDPSCTDDNHDTHQAAHPLWVPFTEWSQLLDARACDVLMDEVTGIASSRESHAMPVEVANFLVQLRRRDICLRWTAPAWPRADKIMRECTQAVTHCRGLLPVTEDQEGEDRLWRRRRMFRWQTYDATLFDEFTEGKRQELRPWLTDWHWGPSSPAFFAYDTLDAVLAIGTVTEGGRCSTCGGRRRVPECRCSGHGPSRKTSTPADAATSPAGVEPPLRLVGNLLAGQLAPEHNVPTPPSGVPTSDLPWGDLLAARHRR